MAQKVKSTPEQCKEICMKYLPPSVYRKLTESEIVATANMMVVFAAEQIENFKLKK